MIEPAASFSEVRNAFQQIFIKKRQSGTPKSSQKWSVRPIQAPADCKSTYLFVSPTIKLTFLSAHFKGAQGKNWEKRKVCGETPDVRASGDYWWELGASSKDLLWKLTFRACERLAKVEINLGFFVIYWFGLPNWASSAAAQVRRCGAKPQKMTFLSSAVRKRSSGDTVASPGYCPIDGAAAWSAHARTNGWLRERHANVTQVSSLTHQAHCCASWRTRQRAADCHYDTGRNNLKKKQI